MNNINYRTDKNRKIKSIEYATIKKLYLFSGDDEDPTAVGDEFHVTFIIRNIQIQCQHKVGRTIQTKASNKTAEDHQIHQFQRGCNDGRSVGSCRRIPYTL